MLRAVWKWDRWSREVVNSLLLEFFKQKFNKHMLEVLEGFPAPGSGLD